MYFPIGHNHIVVFYRKIKTLLRNTQKGDVIQEIYALFHVKSSCASYHYHNGQH
jgi:hypothetical protein